VQIRDLGYMHCTHGISRTALLSFLQLKGHFYFAHTMTQAMG
jgi:hypothetical protein